MAGNIKWSINIYRLLPHVLLCIYKRWNRESIEALDISGWSHVHLCMKYQDFSPLWTIMWSIFGIGYLSVGVADGGALTNALIMIALVSVWKHWHSLGRHLFENCSGFISWPVLLGLNLCNGSQSSLSCVLLHLIYFQTRSRSVFRRPLHVSLRATFGVEFTIRSISSY